MNANTLASDALPVGAVFQENPAAPQMVIIPAGTYTMGAPATEVAVPPDPQDQGRGIQREITIAKPFAAGRFAVTRREFQAFVEATNYRIPDRAYGDEKSGTQGGADWHNPGFAQDENHPVVCVSWHDAMAYVAWLSGLTGSHYRLLSEPEREYACRSGSQGRFWWGDAISPYRANYKESDLIWRKATVPVPVGSYGPNRWSLSEMHGNVSEWCSDTWHTEWSVVSGRQADEINLDGDDPARRAVRGGSWKDGRILCARRFAKRSMPTDDRIRSVFASRGRSRIRRRFGSK